MRRLSYNPIKTYKVSIYDKKTVSYIHLNTQKISKVRLLLFNA